MNDRVALCSTAGLSVFRVAPDGKYDVETAGKDHYWMGMVGLA